VQRGLILPPSGQGAEEELYGERPPINPEDVPDLEGGHNQPVCWCWYTNWLS